MNELVKRFAKPSEGLRVINPETKQPLPAEGAAVTHSEYWVRRANDGDVTLTELPVRNASRQRASQDTAQE